MDLIHAVILGIVEGITEFLPISSTGHLILTSGLLGIKQTEFVKTFEIAIQAGAILSVIVLYSGRMRKSFDLGKQVLVAFIPTAVIGFILYKFIKQYLLGNQDVVLISLLAGGIALIGVELLFKKRKRKDATKKEDMRIVSGQITYEKAFIIGLFQSIAVIPGVSRSASTIVGGMLVGVPRELATEFSFLVAVPTMLAATALDLKEPSFAFRSDETLILAAGFVTSFIVALAAIKWLLKYVRSNDFIPFGVYRILIALLYFFFIYR
jgi:undecaprenyl-diphosphatase